MNFPRWFQDLSRADFLRSAGLYVTPERLFLVGARKDLFRVAVTRAEVSQIPKTEDPASRAQAFSEAIRSLLPHFDRAREPLYLCFSPELTICQWIFLPQMARENLSQVVEYEIERHIPFRREEVYYDFLRAGLKGDKLGLILFAIPKKILDEILDTLSSFGVRPRGVETTPTALTNYLLFCTGGVSGPTVILGGQDHAREIIGLDAAGNGWKRGAEILFTHPVPRGEWVRGPLREVFRDCARESRRFFAWGDYADFLGAGEQGPPQFEDLLPLGKSTLWGAKGLEDASFLPAVGAALRGLRESTFHVNLLPGIREDRRARILYLLNIFLAAVLLIAVAGWGVSHPMKEELRLRQLQQENQKLEPSVAALRREEEELNRLRKEISAVFMLSERRGEILRILDELSRIVPTGAYLSGLRYLGTAVEMQGSADNASALIPLLERSPLFENVRFNAPSSRGRDGRETFSLRAEIERPQAKEPQP